MTYITYDDLSEIRKRYGSKRIVFCSGSFDLLHTGHVLFFEDCKKFGDILVVAVGDDTTMRKYKGEQRPILNEHIRLKLVDSLKPVDYCFLDKPFEIGETEFFSPLNFIFRKLKPDVYVINEDASNILGRKKVAEKNNVAIKILGRWCPKEFDNISTTKIIEKIKSLK